MQGDLLVFIGHTSWTPIIIETLQVPAGSGVKDSSRKTDLLYNEYIVYDVAQVFFLFRRSDAFSWCLVCYFHDFFSLSNVLK